MGFGSAWPVAARSVIDPYFTCGTHSAIGGECTPLALATPRIQFFLLFLRCPHHVTHTVLFLLFHPAANPHKHSSSSTTSLALTTPHHIWSPFPPRRHPLHLPSAFFCSRMGGGWRLQCGRGKTQYLASNIRLCDITTGQHVRWFQGLVGCQVLLTPYPVFPSPSPILHTYLLSSPFLSSSVPLLSYDLMEQEF